METVSYVVGVDVRVVPLQPVVQDGDDHSFPRDAFLPHRDHMQVQLGQRGGCPRVLLQERDRLTRHKERKTSAGVERSLLALHPERLFRYYHICEKGQTEKSKKSLGCQGRPLQKTHYGMFGLFPLSGLEFTLHNAASG